MLHIFFLYGYTIRFDDYDPVGTNVHINNCYIWIAEREGVNIVSRRFCYFCFYSFYLIVFVYWAHISAWSLLLNLLASSSSMTSSFREVHNGIVPGKKLYLKYETPTIESIHVTNPSLREKDLYIESLACDQLQAFYYHTENFK